MSTIAAYPRATAFLAATHTAYPEATAIVTEPATRYRSEQITCLAWVQKPNAYGLASKGTALFSTCWDSWGEYELASGNGARKFNGVHSKLRFTEAQERGLLSILRGTGCPPTVTRKALVRMGLVRRDRDGSGLTERGWLLAEFLAAGKADG